MAFILSAERMASVGAARECFIRYREYLRETRDRFPESAYELASSDWYFAIDERRSPHDSRLRELRLQEVEAESGPRAVSLTVRLLNAWRDHFLDFSYPNVVGYSLGLTTGGSGHRDWRYDEFRLAEDGNVVHEIEWAGPTSTGHWQIVASDVRLSVVPIV